MGFLQTFADTLVGSTINVVGRLLCWDAGHEAHLFKAVNDGVNFLVEGVVDGANDKCTFMRATLLRHYPIPVLKLDGASRIFQHEPPSWDSIAAVVELCSGFGGMSQGISACGFHTTLAVDHNDRMCDLYKQQGAADAIVGDVCSDETVCKIWHYAKGAGTIAAGFACQPYSRLGDQRGHLDPRALSLKGVLETAFYLQSQVLILECVTAAASNAHVKSEIQRFLDITGFNCCQIELHLNDVWPSRRSRAWWLISAPFLGSFSLMPWPKSDSLTRVRQVISCIRPWDASDEQALALLPAELSQMASPLQTAWIFAHVAERVHQLRNDPMSFSPPAVLQALISWTLMRCRKVWPSDKEHVTDVKLASLMAFWHGHDHLSIHELMHPPRWPTMPDHSICIASVLDWIIRDTQSHQQIPVPIPSTAIDEPMPIDDTPTPWFESQEHDFGDLPQVSPHECIVVFKHEFSDPVKLVISDPCTVHDMLQAQVKLVGDFQVIQVCNQHGVALPMAHQMQLGEIFFVKCEDSNGETMVVAQNHDALLHDHEHDTLAEPVVHSVDHACHPVVHACAPLPVVSPTAAWTNPIQEPTQQVHAALHDVGECETPSQIVQNSDSVISAAPLLGLSGDQFTTLQPPKVQRPETFVVA